MIAAPEVALLSAIFECSFSMNVFHVFLGFSLMQLSTVQDYSLHFVFGTTRHHSESLFVIRVTNSPTIRWFLDRTSLFDDVGPSKLQLSLYQIVVIRKKPPSLSLFYSSVC